MMVESWSIYPVLVPQFVLFPSPSFLLPSFLLLRRYLFQLHRKAHC
jgi:hypothetical protein